ncbi:MAG: hypothetical protein IPM84_24330 [Anaerolineae bacterium]|nr:hypothetical protein [Anaerolineae bacterium]
MRSKTLMLIGGALLALFVLASVASASLGRIAPVQDPWFILTPPPGGRPVEPRTFWLYLPLFQYSVPAVPPTATPTPTVQHTATATATPSRTPTPTPTGAIFPAIVRELIVAPGEPGPVYALTNSQLLLVSTDRGETWQQAPQGVPAAVGRAGLGMARHPATGWRAVPPNARAREFQHTGGGPGGRGGGGPSPSLPETPRWRTWDAGAPSWAIM